MDTQQIDYLAAYRHEIDYALADGVSLVLRKIREKIFAINLSATEQLQLDTNDEKVIVSVMELDDIDEGLVADDDARSLRAWWWHLGKIRNRTYPAELLPAHLRTVYADTQK